jgi:hypothetical protein
MSKASRQTISMIAMVNGVFITIDNYDLAPELAPTVKWGLEVCNGCMVEFPETGNKEKNGLWCKRKLEEIEDCFNQADSLYSMIVLVSMSTHIMEDLTSKIKDPLKLKLLEPIYDVVTGLSQQIDPQGDCFDAYKEADRLLYEFYKVIGFTQ